ncbi:unnamed protein product [Nezara viridula]|uniref:SEC14-like protein 2 n=1 Tax=Nezara viridula TaxID=85310 RepID=A0A9P0HJY5_NEZVI|nr:unnamed protein product [Nezara viridula]
MPQVVVRDLSDDQRMALMKMRRSVADCMTLPYHDDYFLLRWLRARNFDPVAAEKMLRASMKWRESWGVETIQDWPTPEVFKHYYPCGVCGFDKDGSPVVIIPFSGVDIWGMLHSATKADFIKTAIKTLEKTLEIAREKSEIHNTYESTKLVGILDMSEFNLKQFAWRPAAEAVISLIQIYEANYPEILKACYIINVPKVFSLAFSVVKNFLNDYTLSKIRIFKSDPNKWKPVLLSHIPPDQLPVIYGGTMCDPDGNPRCPSKVNQGGKIPKSFYIKNQNEKDKNEEYSSVTVKKGDKLRLDYSVPEGGSFLKWGFYSDEHDIKFGVLVKDDKGKETSIIPVHRVTCNETEEIGVVSCPKPATYTVIFDNSYSYLRNKKLHYTINVVPPINGSTDVAVIDSEE